MPTRVYEICDDTLDQLDQVARTLAVSPQRALERCIHEGWLSLKVEALAVVQGDHTLMREGDEGE